MAAVLFVFVRSRISNPWRVHIFSRWDQNQERLGVWKKVQHLQKKYNCQWTLLRGKKPKWILHNFGNLLQPLASVPDSRKHVVPTEWQVPTVLGRLCFQGKGYFNSSATVSAVRAGQWLPGSCQFGHTRRSSIGHCDRPGDEQFT